MSVLRRSLLALLLVLPASLAAQTATRDDLVGSWVSSMKHPKGRQDAVWTFRADSTWTYENKLNDSVYSSMGGRWFVAGDTLWLGDPAATDTMYLRHLGGEVRQKWPARPYRLTKSKLAFPNGGGEFARAGAKP